jgi:hypothetical protein
MDGACKLIRLLRSFKGGRYMKELYTGIGLFLLLSLILAQEPELIAENIPQGIAPTIDGIISSGEWIAAHTKSVALESSDGEIKNAEVYLEHDNGMFYFALVVEGESEEIYVWLGDDEFQAFQKGTDLKRCPKSDSYMCSDWYYRGVYDFVEDDQQDTGGAGHYDAEKKRTTVEIEIPFDSGDVNDYFIDVSRAFTIIYGSIHKSSPDKEYYKTEPVIFWAWHWEKEAQRYRGDALWYENRAKEKQEEGKCFFAAEYWASAVLEWGRAATCERNSAKYWREEARYLRQAAEQLDIWGDSEGVRKAEERAEEAEERAEEAEERAEEDDGRAGVARKNAEAAHEETVESEPKPEPEEDEKGACLGTMFILLVMGGCLCFRRT